MKMKGSVSYLVRWVRLIFITNGHRICVRLTYKKSKRIVKNLKSTKTAGGEGVVRVSGTVLVIRM